MNKKLTILFFFHLILFCLSQTKPPESYSLIRGVNENINLNRGLVDLTLPLFDITEGGFKLSNSLNYESRGFVPYLYPSFVGLNWNLNQFGKITRESRKIDLTTTANKILNPFYGHSGGSLNDLQYSSFQYDDVRSYDRNDCIKTIFANNVNKKEIYDNSGDYYATNQFSGLAGYYGKSYNYEPDKYYFDFMGYKGYFVVDNTMKPVVHCENASLKVDISGVNCYDIFGNISFSQFVIHDDKGNKYYFGGNTDALDINYSYNRFTYYIPVDTAPFTYKGSSSNRTNYIDSWLLKKIVLANGSEIDAYYRQNDLTLLNNYRGTYSGYNGQQNINYTQENHHVYYINENTGFPAKQALLQNNLSVKHSRSIMGGFDNTMESFETQVDTYTKMAVLDSIRINDVTVAYKYHNTLNPLELSNNYLDEIIVKKKNKTIKKIDLAYQELGGSNKRTFLKHINNSTGEDIGLDYYNTDDFPAYKNSAILTHIGGVWNGSHSIYYPPTATQYQNSYDTGLLKKVTYPTKGNTTYSYEFSDYSKIMAYSKNYNGINILDYQHSLNAPRIKKKVERSMPGDSVVTKYSYLNDAGISSGVLEAGKLYSVAIINGTYLKNLLGPVAPNIQGLVKYSLVKVSPEGKGYNKLYFSDYLTNSDTLTVRYDHQGHEYLSKSNERGKLLKELVYNNNNTLLKETTYKYRNFLGKLPVINSMENCTTCKVSDLNYYISVKSEPIMYNNNNYYSYNNKYTMYVPVIPYLLSSQTTKEYFGDKVIETVKKNIYNDTSNNWGWHPYPIEESLTTSAGTATKRYLFAPDLIKKDCRGFRGCRNENSAVGSQWDIYEGMIASNFLVPLIEITKNTDNKYSLKENLFTKGTSFLYAPKKIRHSLANAVTDFNNYNISLVNNIVDDVDFNVYDNKANSLQSTMKDGIPVTTIYGYDQTLPIATITGISYEQLMQIFGLPATPTGYLSLDIVSKSNTDKDEAGEQLLLTALNNFRKNASLSGYQITTYTYDPLIGVRSITPPSGIRENYLYDSAGRLQKIVDVNGQTVKEMKYNYKN
jgi:hypothetical protein